MPDRRRGSGTARPVVVAGLVLAVLLALASGGALASASADDVTAIESVGNGDRTTIEAAGPVENDTGGNEAGNGESDEIGGNETVDGDSDDGGENGTADEVSDDTDTNTNETDDEPSEETDETETRSGVCRDVPTNETVVLATVPGREPLAGNATVSLHRDSEIDVRLCPALNATETWQLSTDDDRVAVVEQGDFSDRYRVRLTGGDLWLGDLVSPAPGEAPTIHVADAAVETDLVDGRLPVPSEAAAQRVRDAERISNERWQALEAERNAVDEAIDALEAGDSPPPGTADSMQTAHREYLDVTDDLQSVLYDVGHSHAGGPTTTAAIETVDDRERAATAETEGDLAAYERALADREETLVRSLRLRVAGVLAIGLTVGTLLGAALPIYRGRQARAALARGEWVRYEPRVVLVPVVLGLLLLVAGLGWIALELGWTLPEALA